MGDGVELVNAMPMDTWVMSIIRIVLFSGSSSQQ